MNFPLHRNGFQREYSAGRTTTTSPLCRIDGMVHAMVAESCGANLIKGDIHTDGMNYTKYVFKSIDKHKMIKVVRGMGGSHPNGICVANLC